METRIVLSWDWSQVKADLHLRPVHMSGSQLTGNSTNFL